mgnify:CR=1 FL=1
MEVGGPDFAACTQTAGAVVRTSGEDRLALDTAGRRWFFCGVGPHCKSGMKLKIIVLDTAAPTRRPAPTNPAGKLQAHFGERAAAVTALAAALLML